MKLDELIAALSQPGAYPHKPPAVDVHQTHISVVFLAGTFAYKIKKPVNLGFLDFSTLEKRRRDCDDEVRLNRRLARDVYLDVVPVRLQAGEIAINGAAGEVVEWAVKMRRLPDDANLRSLLKHDLVRGEMIDSLARTVADFHAHAETTPRVAAFGRFDVVAGNMRENLEQVVPQIGETVSRPVWERLRELTEQHLVRLRPLIEARAQRGVTRDTHGDLRLDHVYYLRGPAHPDDVTIIDCIEFNERFRFADPVADVAFLMMDLRFQNRGDLARRFADAYFQAAGDDEGRSLVPLYIAYRAAVRGKVEGFALREKEIPQAERDAARTQARAHWLFALGELETPGLRPALVLVGGLPGTGKSTLARALAEQAGFEVIRSDVVRKELAPAAARVAAAFGQGIYTPEWTERTYGECLSRARTLLFEGRRVIVDASFGQEAHRQMFLDAGRRLQARTAMVICSADAEVVRRRLAARHGDASDADWAVYEEAARRWQDVMTADRRVIATDGANAVDEARTFLRDLDLD